MPANPPSRDTSRPAVWHHAGRPAAAGRIPATAGIVPAPVRYVRRQGRGRERFSEPAAGARCVAPRGNGLAGSGGVHTGVRDPERDVGPCVGIARGLDRPASGGGSRRPRDSGGESARKHSGVSSNQRRRCPGPALRSGVTPRSLIFVWTFGRMVPRQE